MARVAALGLAACVATLVVSCTFDFDAPFSAASAPAAMDGGFVEACAALACSDVGAACGRLPDGCGGSVECGTCGGAMTCGAAGSHRCGVGSCTRRSCVEAAACGTISNGCDGVLDCGSCDAGDAGPPEPDIIFVAPPSAWNDEPIPITITGLGFLPGAIVSVGGVLVTVTSVEASGNRLHAVVSAGATVGKLDVTVKNPGQSEVSCAGCYEATAPVLVHGLVSGLLLHPGRKVVFDADTALVGYDGVADVTQCDAGEPGCLRVEAAKIVVAAGVAVDGAGKGWGGGGGGGGAVGRVDSGCSAQPKGTCQGGGTTGSGGLGVAGGSRGLDGYCAEDCCGVGDDHCSRGGKGGAGGGIAGGAGGASGLTKSQISTYGTAGASGGDGQYATLPDQSTDNAVTIGSAGGGGGGGAGNPVDRYCDSASGAGGGGAGSRGGGKIELVASQAIEVRGALRTAGASIGGNGGEGQSACPISSSQNDGSANGGTGGSADVAGSQLGGGGGGSCNSSFECNGSVSYGSGPWVAWPGGAGGRGGTGSGGGVLVQSPSVVISGTIDARDGSGSTARGGTVKIFYQGQAPSTANVAAQRVWSAVEP